MFILYLLKEVFLIYLDIRFLSQNLSCVCIKKEIIAKQTG